MFKIVIDSHLSQNFQDNFLFAFPVEGFPIRHLLFELFSYNELDFLSCMNRLLVDFIR